MLKNTLFSIKQENKHKVIKIFGIKFKFLSNNQLRKEIDSLPRYKELSLFNLYILDKCNQLNLETKKRIISQKFFEKCGYFPDLKNPKSYNEKINWMKLYYNNSEQKRCVDKFEFKNYVNEKLGRGYTIPAIGVFEDIDDINFDELPNQFVIKSTIYGGRLGLEIVKDKSKLNLNRVKTKFTKYLQEWRTAYYDMLAKGYEGLKPRIIIEEYIPSIQSSSYEYKFFCFNGEPKLFYAINYYTGEKELNYYDMNFNMLPFRNGDFKNSGAKKHTPSQKFDLMVELAKKISKDFPFVRVDFYDTKEQLYLGELTFTPTGGFAKYKPREWDYKLGDYLDLSNIFANNLAIPTGVK